MHLVYTLVPIILRIFLTCDKMLLIYSTNILLCEYFLWCIDTVKMCYVEIHALGAEVCRLYLIAIQNHDLYWSTAHIRTKSFIATISTLFANWDCRQSKSISAILAASSLYQSRQEVSFAARIVAAPLPIWRTFSVRDINRLKCLLYHRSIPCEATLVVYFTWGCLISAMDGLSCIKMLLLIDVTMSAFNPTTIIP